MDSDHRDTSIDASWERLSDAHPPVPEGLPTENSIRAPIAIPLARNEWEPIPISALGIATPPEWIWEKYIARGHSSLFTALWKSGKTTMIGNLLRDIATGGGMVGSASSLRTLVITEESTTQWCRRRDQLGLTDQVHVLSRPFMAKPDAATWVKFIECIVKLVIERGYGLVVMDTISALWPVYNENDAGEVSAALMPLNLITELGAGLLLVHHPRKGGGDEAQGSRGSGALPGFVDVIIEMRRTNKDDMQDRKRTLSVLSRLNDEASETVVQLTDNGYVVLGEAAEATQAARMETIARILPTEGRGDTAEELLARWPSGMRPAIRALQTDLNHGVVNGRWLRTGKGVKGDPYRYSLAVFDSRSSLSTGARNESEISTSPKEGGDA